MKLYEVNEQIIEILNELEPDPETGEIPMNSDELWEKVEKLGMERKRILEYLAKVVINIRSDKDALKTEEKRLHDRRSVLDKKEERLMAILDRECGGEKTDLGVATICYRKTTSVDVTDNGTAVRWLLDNGIKDAVKVAEPEISKTKVKDLLNKGIEIPGIELKQGLSCSLR